MKNFESEMVEYLRKHSFLFYIYCGLAKARHGMSRRHFREDLRKYQALNDRPEFLINKRNNMPMLLDYRDNAGNVGGHYFFQDIYIARKILQERKSVHYDIGSRVDGFIGHLLSAGQRVVLLDIRPLNIEIDGLEFKQTDATSLKEIEDGSIESISSLHAIEHFGLGRYGDEINPNAWREALSAIETKIKPKGGKLYLSVPVGKEQKLCFNAHRIYNPKTIVDALPNMKLISWAYIHDNKIYEGGGIEDSCLGTYDCGMFIFEKM